MPFDMDNLAKQLYIIEQNDKFNQAYDAILVKDAKLNH